MINEIFIFAQDTTKIKIFSVDIQMHAVSFGKIGLANRIFDHDVINLGCSLGRNRPRGGPGWKHPGF
jgi:hypothetical protein